MNILEEIGLEAMLGQLAEECCELGKAALKLQRIIHGTNPTPVTKEQAYKDLLEEATDVNDCLILLEVNGIKTFSPAQSNEKMQRWENRIREAKNG